MNPIDIPQIAETYGPLVALFCVCLFAMGLVIRALWTRLNNQTDERFLDQKEHVKQLMAMTQTLDQAMSLLGGNRRE